MAQQSPFPTGINKVLYCVSAVVLTAIYETNRRENTRTNKPVRKQRLCVYLVSHLLKKILLRLIFRGHASVFTIFLFAFQHVSYQRECLDSESTTVSPWQTGKRSGVGWRRGRGGPRLASGTCPELSSWSPQTPPKNDPPRPSSQTSLARAGGNEER